VIPQGAPILLDTNILIHLVRGSVLGKRLSEEHGLLGRPDRPLISIVTVGECLAMATRLGWGEAKQGALRNLLAELVVLDLRHPGVIGKYAEIAAHCVERGLGIGQNDLWIAGTASATGAWLLTTDQDFLPLSPQHLHLELVEPGS
jgi:predicted nucleic acid-binding protein